jgi:thermitase
LKRVFLVLSAVAIVGCQDQAEPLGPSPSGAALGLGQVANVAPFLEGRVLARFTPGAQGAAIAASHGADLREELLVPGIWVLEVPVGAEVAIAAALARSPNVAFAEPDWILATTPCELSGGCPTVSDPFFGRKWDLHNSGSILQTDGSVLGSTGEVDADIDWLEAYGVLGTDFGGAAVIGILDTGIRNTHEDLAGKVWKNRNFEGLVKVDPAKWNDTDGHGSHVAGIAAAWAGNGGGVAGVGYGANIRLINARVCGRVGCPTSSIANGISWAADEGANVLNLSLGGPNPQTPIRDALIYAAGKNVLAFCASGNDGANAVSYPAAFDECVAVGGTTWSDTRAGYSNWGPQVELSAPGGDSNPAGTPYSYIASASNGADNSYVYMAGTSMATPQAAGLAALVYAAGVTDRAALRTHLRNSVDDLGAAGRDQHFGFGRINAFLAVKDLDAGSGDPGGDPGEGDPDPPTTVPVASFGYACGNTSTCSFTDSSTGSISSWEWSFPSGSPSSSTQQNASTTYGQAGTFSVTLTVTGSGGSDTATASIACTSHPRQGIRCR